MAGLERYLADPSRVAWEEVAREPALEPARYARAHVDQRLAQLDAVLDDARWFVSTLEAHLAREGEAGVHLWATESVGDAARTRLAECRGVVALLVRRLDQLRERFNALPRLPE